MKVKVGICQLEVNSNKDINYENMQSSVNKLVLEDVKIVILPECWNCPYGIEYFQEYSEDINNSKSIKLMSEISKNNKIYLIGGSVPIKDDKKYYNTCFCFNIDGEIIGRYDKIHLFDINLDYFSFKESSVLSPGTKPLIIDTIYGKIGIGICYDLRFPLLANYYSENNCIMVVYPGSFSEKTGPYHWSLLLRCRALDNQCYVIGCSTSENNNFDYKGYGHSCITGPWGDIIYEANEKPTIFTKEIDLEYIKDIRKQIPLLKNKYLK